MKLSSFQAELSCTQPPSVFIGLRLLLRLPSLLDSHFRRVRVHMPFSRTDSAERLELHGVIVMPIIASKSTDMPK